MIVVSSNTIATRLASAAVDSTTSTTSPVSSSFSAIPRTRSGVARAITHPIRIRYDQIAKFHAIKRRDTGCGCHGRKIATAIGMHATDERVDGETVWSMSG